MPRVTKDAEKKEELNEKKSTKKSTTTKKKVDTPKKTSNKKSSSSKISTATKKTSTSRKTTTKKSATTEKKKTSSSTVKKKTTSSKTVKKVTKVEKNIIAEYYDLPYRYNETIVKILYQTPTILFVYWDISDFDRNRFINEYGEHFFNNTKPMLKIYNLTKNYNFEIEINDFANSWYINVNDANCEYKVELYRKNIENSEIPYIHISSSNNIEFPNNRILLDELPDNLNFRNVKTNSITTKNISTMRLIGINKIYKVHEFYKRFYKDELLNDSTISTSTSSWN